MMSARTIYPRKNQKIFSSDIKAEFRDNFDMIKRYKNLFRKNSNLNKNKNIFFKDINLYKSYINSSAPYNYIKVPSEKNTYLICFNGGPQIYTYVESNKLNNEMDKKEIIYGEKKSCGCFTKLYVPKLKRCLSNLENYKINRGKFNMKRTNSGYNPNYYERNISFLKNNRDWTPNPKRFITKPGFINDGLLKRITNENNIYKNYTTNYENRVRINFEDSKNTNDDNKNRRNRYDNLLFTLNKNINKKFHKTQIFDHCKPFLSEGL